MMRKNLETFYDNHVFNFTSMKEKNSYIQKVK